MPISASLDAKKDIIKCRKIKIYRFECFPTHLLAEILASVASRSFTDLFNAKLSCKDFLDAASENVVFEHATIERFPVLPWNNLSEGASRFLDRCTKSGNPEALFRRGMVEYFSTLKPESGLEYLKKAAEKGHPEATYVYGIISVCYGGERKQKGLEILSSLTNSKSRISVIRQCRKRTRYIFSLMWKRNYIVGTGQAEESMKCSKSCNVKGEAKKAGWKLADEELDYDTTSCDSCLWEHETTSFCRMLRTGSFR